MPGKDGVLRVDEHRVGEAEGAYAVGDLSDLLRECVRALRAHAFRSAMTICSMDCSVMFAP